MCVYSALLFASMFAIAKKKKKVSCQGTLLFPLPEPPALRDLSTNFFSSVVPHTTKDIKLTVWK